MTPEQFCYWLQGYFELKKTIDHRDGATPETMKVIEDHLKLVLTKVTPERVTIGYPDYIKDSLLQPSLPLTVTC